MMVDLAARRRQSNDFAVQDTADDSRREPRCESVGANDCGSRFSESVLSSNADEYRPLRVTVIAIAGHSAGLADTSTICESDGFDCTAAIAWAEESLPSVLTFSDGRRPARNR